MTAATLEPPFTIEEIAKRPLTIDEVANVYARPISFVHAWLASGRLALNGDGLLPWRDVVSAHCGGGAEESSLHREFAEDRAHGEWFRATPRLLAGAKASRNLYGLPEWAT